MKNLILLHGKNEIKNCRDETCMLEVRYIKRWLSICLFVKSKSLFLSHPLLVVEKIFKTSIVFLEITIIKKKKIKVVVKLLGKFLINLRNSLSFEMLLVYKKRIQSQEQKVLN